VAVAAAQLQKKEFEKEFGMEKRGILVFLAFALAIFSISARAAYLETAQVMDIAKNYIIFPNEQFEFAKGSPAKPMLFGEGGYWVAYYYSAASAAETYDSSYHKIAIADDDTMRVVRDEEVLSALFSADYEYAWEVNYVAQRWGLSFEQVDSAALTASQTLMGHQRNLDIGRDRVLARKSDPALEAHFDRLDGMITEMTAMLEDLSGQEVAAGKMSQKIFASTSDVESYRESVSGYNATFAKLALFMQKAEEFFKLISDSSAYSSLDSDEKDVINKIYTQGLGTDALPSYVQLTDGIIPQFSAMREGEAAAVNDSVKNALFRAAKAEAKMRYQAELSAKPFSTQQLLDSYKTESYKYDRCDVGDAMASLSALWGNVTGVMERSATRDEYDGVIGKIGEAASKREIIWGGIQDCWKGANSTPTPTGGGGGLVDGAIIVVLAVLAGLGLVQWQKMQKRRQMEEEA
jgi:hypothetical protein